MNRKMLRKDKGMKKGTTGHVGIGKRVEGYREEEEKGDRGE